MLPPLNVTAETVDLACEILATSLREAIDGLPTAHSRNGHASGLGSGVPSPRTQPPLR
jgi:alpha-ketoglutarate-dependent taurine dioxygenase